MNKKLFMLAVAFVGVAGMSYAGGDSEDGGSTPAPEAPKTEAKTEDAKPSIFCRAKCCVKTGASRTLDMAALDNIPFLSSYCSEGKSLVALKLAKAAAVVGLVYKSGVAGWVRKNVIAKVPGCGLEVDEEAAA